MKRVCLAVAVLSTLAGCGGGGGGGGPQPNDPGYISKLTADVDLHVDQVVRDYQFSEHIAGISVGVVEGGQVVLAKGYGAADIGPGTPVDANTPFEVGSVTKSFTAFGVLRMVDDPSLIRKQGINGLSLDERVKTYIGDSPNVQMPASWDNITVGELLSMTSGIPDGSSNTKIWQVVVAEAAAKALGFDPGVGYCYSNPAYMVLGELIQQLSGMAYADYMATYVFTPLGLTNTFIHLPGNTPAKLAKGYEWLSSTWQEPAPRSPLSSFSAGAVITTAGDLAKYLVALEQKKLLKAATYQLMFTAVELPTRNSEWGLGWNVVKTDTFEIYRKDGGLPGYSAQLSIFKNAGICIALCTNESGVGTAQIAADIAAAVKKVDTMPNPPGPISDCN
jgi:CubicO group peptidase (beta-lactamase class C family)